MRFYNILLCVFIMFLFSSCGKKETINETNIPVISENDYFSADIVSKTENSVRFKETISFTQAYPNSNVINLTNLEKPREDAQVIFVDNAGNIYITALLYAILSLYIFSFVIVLLLTIKSPNTDNTITRV